jgi:hypothetical protein
MMKFPCSVGAKRKLDMQSPMGGFKRGKPDEFSPLHMPGLGYHDGSYNPNPMAHHHHPGPFGAYPRDGKKKKISSFSISFQSITVQFHQRRPRAKL